MKEIKKEYKLGDVLSIRLNYIHFPFSYDSKTIYTAKGTIIGLNEQLCTISLASEETASKFAELLEVLAHKIGNSEHYTNATRYYRNWLKQSSVFNINTQSLTTIVAEDGRPFKSKPKPTKAEYNSKEYDIKETTICNKKYYNLYDNNGAKVKTIPYKSKNLKLIFKKDAIK